MVGREGEEEAEEVVDVLEEVEEDTKVSAIAVTGGAQSYFLIQAQSSRIVAFQVTLSSLELQTREFAHH